jgi:hypothetical protein
MVLPEPEDIGGLNLEFERARGEEEDALNIEEEDALNITLHMLCWRGDNDEAAGVNTAAGESFPGAPTDARAIANMLVSDWPGRPRARKG